MSDLSIDTKKHTTKSRETIPLIQFSDREPFSDILYGDERLSFSLGTSLILQDNNEFLSYK
jgi:hypothetical protein